MSDITVWGIDLGTTYSAIGRIDPLGRAEVVQNREGQYTTPSVVLFEPGTGVAVVGQEAKNEAVQNPDRVVEFVKRSMGQEGWTKEVDGREYRPEEVSALILRKLAEDAEEGTGEPVQNVVITVPAYFNDLERAATETAGQLAGLNVLDILNEPTAAAIYYAKLEEEKGGTLTGNVLVYDLGGGTFDITVIRVSDEGIDVVVTDGNHSLGGKDWDDALIRYVASEFETAYGVAPMEDLQSLQELRVNCENAKRSLSNRDSAKVAVSCQGQHGSVEVTREKFDEITSNLLAQTIELTEQCVANAAERGAVIDEVLLVGGSSRMKQVDEAVRAALGKEPRLFEPDMAVAKGASIQAAYRVVGGDSVVVADSTGEAVDASAGVQIPGITASQVRQARNVLSHSLGVILWDEESQYNNERVSILIEKQAPVPAEKTEQFFTVGATDQVRIRVTQGEDENPAECTLLTQQELQLSRVLPAHSPIQIEYRLNDRGMLEVTVIDMTDGVRMDFPVERVGSMTEDEIEQSKAEIAAVELRQ